MLFRPTITAPVTEWRKAEGYGFLQAGKRRIFLHCRDMVQRHATPNVGDIMRFRVAYDRQGRIYARRAVNIAHVEPGHRNRFQPRFMRRGKLHLDHGIILVGLLILPVLAILRLPILPLWPGLYAVGISAVTFWVYGHDKKQAHFKRWRTPEKTLRYLEFFGGWPGAFLAQHWQNHKTTKKWYQFGFWTIVAFHEYLALDYLIDWRMTRFVVYALFEGFRS